MKRFGVTLALMLFAGQSMFGFALLGPVNEAYQVNVIGYNLTPPASAFGDDGNGSDVGAPKNFQQGYRWNTPVNYYAYDSTFLEYFGSNGVAAVDAAFAMFNHLTNASNLNPLKFPLQSTRINYRAHALNLVDLKSYTMSMIIEQLGLAQPDRYTWCLHDRYLPGGAQCPNYEYLIIQRNFDPVGYNYSDFVNGVLYDYEIEELCPLQVNPYAPLEADAVEFQVDPTTEATSFGSVAAYGSANSVNNFGTFFLNFTRDDIGGLKYLYSATNWVREQVETNSLMVITNTPMTNLYTSNLSIFLQAALTNDAAALETLYPGLVILNTTTSYTNVTTTNVTAYLVTNVPGQVVGTIGPVFVTNYTHDYQTLYHHTFANVEVLQSYQKIKVAQQTIMFGQKPGTEYGPPQLFTNTVYTMQTITNGDFYILPTNMCGPYQILTPPNANTYNTAVTNFIPVFTNGITFTNALEATAMTQSVAIITFYTNYNYEIQPVNCLTNATAVREGVDKLIFVRQDYDSLLNSFWTPVTNVYQLTAITNNMPVVQTFQRILTQPDIIISATDLANGPSGPLANSAVTRTVPHWNTTLVQTNQGGPGTIQPQGVNFTYNSVGPVYYNVGPFFQLGDGVVYFTQTNSAFDFQWGSFDGSTNLPVVYPSTASILAMETQLFFQITSGFLPRASLTSTTASNPYNYQLQVSGGTAPYSWSLATNSPALPPGLSMSTDGVISGVPTTTGTYDFTVQVTDSGSVQRITQQPAFIVVTP